MAEAVALPEEVKARTKVLVILGEHCPYPGVDHVGQQHLEYPSNYYVVRVLAPVIVPEDLYLKAFEEGFDGIIVASCGTDCPYPGAYEQTAERINRVYAMMKERGLDSRRLRLTAVCSVCAHAFLKEVAQMNQVMEELGPVQRPLPPPASQEGEGNES
ncbi:MAG: hydrogenase iron-sulfur subunit [Armatimonadetes bacterium]|nr:hydrogenase iron-sulfur subunit [Armatimonadota bacterium]